MKKKFIGVIGHPSASAIAAHHINDKNPFTVEPVMTIKNTHLNETKDKLNPKLYIRQPSKYHK